MSEGARRSGTRSPRCCDVAERRCQLAVSPCWLAAHWGLAAGWGLAAHQGVAAHWSLAAHWDQAAAGWLDAYACGVAERVARLRPCASKIPSEGPELTWTWLSMQGYLASRRFPLSVLSQSKPCPICQAATADAEAAAAAAMYLFIPASLASLSAPPGCGRALQQLRGRMGHARQRVGALECWSGDHSPWPLGKGGWLRSSRIGLSRADMCRICRWRSSIHFCLLARTLRRTCTCTCTHTQTLHSHLRSCCAGLVGQHAGRLHAAWSGLLHPHEGLQVRARRRALHWSPQLPCRPCTAG